MLETPGVVAGRLGKTGARCEPKRPTEYEAVKYNSVDLACVDDSRGQLR